MRAPTRLGRAGRGEHRRDFIGRFRPGRAGRRPTQRLGPVPTTLAARCAPVAGCGALRSPRLAHRDLFREVPSERGFQLANFRIEVGDHLIAFVARERPRTAKVLLGVVQHRLQRDAPPGSIGFEDRELFGRRVAIGLREHVLVELPRRHVDRARPAASRPIGSAMHLHCANDGGHHVCPRRRPGIQPSCGAIPRDCSEPHRRSASGAIRSQVYPEAARRGAAGGGGAGQTRRRGWRGSRWRMHRAPGAPQLTRRTVARR